MRNIYKILYEVAVIMAFTVACGQGQNKADMVVQKKEISSEPSPVKKLIEPNGNTIHTRVLLPEGYNRIPTNENSFAGYLRNLPVKPFGTKAKYYDGTDKLSNVYDAVIDLKIGKKDLHQCADAVMRLRAEYLWHQGRFNEIHFNFTNGFRVDYAEWMKGKRVIVEGNKCYWVQREAPSNTYNDFWNYMEKIFTYAGTLSLDKELKPVEISDMKPGDVFIQGGSPGHAVIVVDLAVNDAGDKLFLLAQSYMPAQEIHVLKNFENTEISPWYSVNFQAQLNTPQWVFGANKLKRFED